MSFEKVARGARREGPAPAGARPASPSRSSSATTCWSRSARRTPSRGSSAMPASPSTSGACRCSTGHAAVEPAARLLRRRRRARPEEHHLGGRAGPCRGDLDRQVPARRGRRRAAAARRDAGVAEDGHPRVELRQRHHARRCATRCRGATSTSRCATSRSRSSSASTSPTAWKEAQRCLNCDVQTVFTTGQCIECDACVDICPTDCITFTANGDEADLRDAPARAGAST